MESNISFKDKLLGLKDYIELEKYDTVIKECCTVFEVVLKKIVSQAISELPFEQRSKILNNELEIGKGKKGFSDFTFGELVGLFRKSDLLSIWSNYTNKNLGLIQSINLSPIVDLRNKLQHGHIYKCSSCEARLVYEYLINWLAFLGYADLDNNISNAFKKNVSVIQSTDNLNIKKYSTINHKRESSIYSSSYGNEKERLEIQAKNAEAVDFQAFNYALKLFDNKKDIVALDIGCSSGIVTFSRFNKFDNFAKIIGLDFNKQNIINANNNNYGEKYYFFEADVESNHLEIQLDEILSSLNVDKIDFIFSALTIHHLKNPEKLLRRLRRYMSENGVIILRGSDDGSKLAYPDDGLVEKIIEKTLQLQGVSDRLNGRKLYTQLYKSGYQRIKMFYQVKDTGSMNFDERYNLFFESFMYRKDYFEKQLKKEPNNNNYIDDYDWICESLEKLEELFVAPEFYYSELDYVVFGVKS